MAEFGETTVLQTTLASMFPISYELMRSSYMLPRTPASRSPLAPEKVRSLITGPFSLTYTGSVKIAELNTELLFLARALCAPNQSVAGGLGVIGGPGLLIDITFNDVTLDDVTVPLVIQGINLSGNLGFSGSLTAIGMLHIGYCSTRDLTFASEVTIASLEFYDNHVHGSLILSSGVSLTSLLVYGNYPQISFVEVSNKKFYPSLDSLMYLNSSDGREPRDIPIGSRGFGAFSLTGLSAASYPHIISLAAPDPWSVDIATLFPNLVSLFVIEYPPTGAVAIPETPTSRYTSLTMISAKGVTSIDLRDRASYLSLGLRIVGCSQLSGVILGEETGPIQQYKTFVIERSGLLYLRGARSMIRAPSTLRLGDHTAPALSVPSKNTGTATTRLLDYVLRGMPTLGGGSSVPAVPSDYLPNVLVSLAETLPAIVLYPVMQTVEYSFNRPASVVALDPAGGKTSTFTQYSGGANPVVPSASSTLTSAVITVSPFGIRYTLQVSPSTTGSGPLGLSVAGLVTSPQTTARGNTKKSILSSLGVSSHHGVSNVLIGLVVAGIIVVIVAVVVTYSVSLSKKRKVKRVQPSGTHLTP